MLADLVLRGAPRRWEAFVAHATAAAPANESDQRARAAQLETLWADHETDESARGVAFVCADDDGGGSGGGGEELVELPLVSVAAWLGDAVVVEALLRLDGEPGRHHAITLQQVADGQDRGLACVLRSPGLALDDAEIGSLVLEAAAAPAAARCLEVLLESVQGEGSLLWALCNDLRFHDEAVWPFTVFELAVITAASHVNSVQFHMLLQRAHAYMTATQQRRVLFRLVEHAAEGPLVAFLRHLPALIRELDDIEFEQGSAAECLRRRVLFQLWFEPPDVPGEERTTLEQSLSEREKSMSLSLSQKSASSLLSAGV